MALGSEEREGMRVGFASCASVMSEYMCTRHECMCIRPECICNFRMHSCISVCVCVYVSVCVCLCVSVCLWVC